MEFSSVAPVALLGYLLGSIPTAYWFSLLVYRINIFEHGSKNMGATNVHRVLGSRPFALVLTLDILKGWAAVLMAGLFTSNPALLMPLKLIAGAAAVTGHTLSFWVRFRGGKGVATGLGVFLGLAPIASVAAMFTFLVVLIISGYVSLGSIVSAISLPIFIGWLREGGPDWSIPLASFAAVVAAFIVYKHKANIGRLLRGEELSLRQPKSPS